MLEITETYSSGHTSTRRTVIFEVAACPTLSYLALLCGNIGNNGNNIVVSKRDEKPEITERCCQMNHTRKCNN